MAMTPAFMEACRAEMTIAPADFATRIFWVAEEPEGHVLGFAGLWPAKMAQPKSIRSMSSRAYKASGVGASAVGTA